MRVWKAAVLLVLVLALAKAGGLPPGEEAAGPPPVKGYVALTFDDGPWPETTERLLDGLSQRGVKATFFLVGRQAEAMEDVVKRMVDEGHQVGLHTWDHVPLRGLSPDQIVAQLEPVRACLHSLAGPAGFMVRPPFGYVDQTVQNWAGAAIIKWSVDTEDWKDGDLTRIQRVVEDETTDGSILLMHDIYDRSVTAALACVDQLLAEGYRLVTVEDLFALRGQTPEPGRVYYALPPDP